MSEPDDERTIALQVRRDRIGETRLVEREHRVGDLEPGQVRLRVERFALTSNNVTYAVFGDALGYWDFHPVADDEGGRWGNVPAMGWATVVESRAPDVALGRRLYGLYPMASHAVITPSATRDGLRDDGAHREQHAAVYRSFVASDADPLYPGGPVDDPSDVDADGEDRHALLRGLFLTGFLAEEFLADGGGSGRPWFGAARAVVLSASSKTAIGFAQRAARRDGITVVGVTSAGNRDFVESLGLYDTVVSYDEIDGVDTDGGAVSIDMAGNADALRSVHERWGDGLAYSMTVGRSHHDAPPADTSDMPGPAPQLFFAPTEVGRRMEEWGREEYGRRCAEALDEFVEGSRSWLTVEHRIGAEAVQQAWADVHDGNVTPDVGIVATFHEPDAT